MPERQLPPEEPINEEEDTFFGGTKEINFSPADEVKMNISVAAAQLPSEMSDNERGAATDLFSRSKDFRVIPEGNDKYRILDTIGKGGQGTAYLAQDLNPEKGSPVLVVIKKPHANSSDEAEARSRREEGYGKLELPGVPRQREPIEWDGVTAIVSDFIPGITVDKIFDDVLPHLEDDIRCRWVEHFAALMANRFCRIQDTFDRIQKKQGKDEIEFVHRDVKPDNILHADSSKLYLLDFGFAKTAPKDREKSDHGQSFIKSLITKDGLGFGTLKYMAPEQVDAANATSRADVWSLNATLCEGLIGKTPYSEQKHVALIIAKNTLGNLPPELEEIREKYGSELADTMELMGELEPTDRLKMKQVRMIFALRYGEFLKQKTGKKHSKIPLEKFRYYDADRNIRYSSYYEDLNELTREIEDTYSLPSTVTNSLPSKKTHHPVPPSGKTVENTKLKEEEKRSPRPSATPKKRKRAPLQPKASDYEQTQILTPSEKTESSLSRREFLTTEGKAAAAVMGLAAVGGIITSLLSGKEEPEAPKKKETKRPTKEVIKTETPPIRETKVIDQPEESNLNVIGSEETVQFHLDENGEVVKVTLALHKIPFPKHGEVTFRNDQHAAQLVMRVFGREMQIASIYNLTDHHQRIIYGGVERAPSKIHYIVYTMNPPGRDPMYVSYLEGFGWHIISGDEEIFYTENENPEDRKSLEGIYGGPEHVRTMDDLQTNPDMRERAIRITERMRRFPRQFEVRNSGLIVPKGLHAEDIMRGKMIDLMEFFLDEEPVQPGKGGGKLKKFFKSFRRGRD